VKILLILICLLLASCSSLGDIEGLGKTGEVLRTMDSSCKRLYGRSCDSKPLLNAPQINRTIGQARQVPYHISTKNVPIIIQEAGVFTK
jgi:hypothetical protein